MPRCGSPRCCGRTSPRHTSRRRWRASPGASGGSVGAEMNAAPDREATGMAEGPRHTDLWIRILSAAVMLAVALAALVIGGPVLDAFIALVALVAFGEL